MAFWRLLRSYDKERIASQLERVRAIIGQHCENCCDHEFALERLDNAFRKWRTGRDLSAEDNVETMDAFGIAYGQFIADTYNLRWVAIPDERRSYALLGGEEILVYPQNVATANHERFDPEEDLFQSLFAVLHCRTAELASMMGPAPDPKWWAIWRR